MTRERVLSGVRPTGPLHFGNYFGAIRNWVSLQEEYEAFFFIADWHSLTTEYADPRRVKAWTDDVLLDLLASGVDPDKCCLFIQSRVPQHAELYLLLGMMTPLGWLERVPSYKEMKEELKAKDLNMHGFLGYPLLQAADILLYKANRVPVGEDQVSHLELTREIVRRFHHLYGCELFPEPRVLLTSAPKVPGLDRRKMSKSYDNCIYLKDSAEAVAKKIMPAVTDPARKRRDDPGNPEICLMYDYHQLFSDQATRDHVNVECRRAGIGCVDDKKILLEKMETVLGPIRERRAAWAQRPKDLREIVEHGSARARTVAGETLSAVRDAMGIAS